MATQPQIKAIHALLNKFHLRDEKANIVRTFTGQRTTHSSKMTNDEAAALIGHLKSMDKVDRSADKMRNYILAMAHEMGWEKKVESEKLRAGMKPVDIQHVNNWCKIYGYLHKNLDDYTYAELPRLVSQFEAVYKDHLKST